MSNQGKIAFFISPIGDLDSPERKRSDIIKESFLKPILDLYDFNCVRADEISKPGRIDIQVIEYLIQSQLVIADLSDHNANVFYELAVRHATQKPVILIIEEGQQIPFDIRTHRTIYYDMTDGPKFLNAQQAFKKQVEFIVSNKFVVDSPIREVILKPDKPDETNLLKEINSIVRTNSEILNDVLNIIKPKKPLAADKQVSVDKFRVIRRNESVYNYIALGRDITAGGEVEIYLDKVDKDRLLGKFIAKPDGSWEGNIDIPPNTDSGDHYLWMKDVKTGSYESNKIEI